MHRFHLPPGECRSQTLTLTGREAHHALQVLRVRGGERVTVLDGAGTEFLCDVRNVSRGVVGLEIVESQRIPPPPCQITLLQAIPKGKMMEDIIEKATELGAHRIVPILSERVTTRLDDRSAADKVDKWRLVASEAIKQCGNAWLPRVDAPITLSQFLALKENVELGLIASLQDDRRPAREHFQKFRADHGRLPTSVWVWVGPEGDFTPAEVQAIRHAGALPITLGRLVLRCETAAVCCLAILNYELQPLLSAGESPD